MTAARAQARIDRPDDYIRRALTYADPLALRVLLAQLGDDTVGEVPLTMVPGLVFGEMAVIGAPDAAQRLQDRVLYHLRRLRDEGIEFPPPPSERASLHRLMELAVCAPIPEQEHDFWVEELAIHPMARQIDFSSVPESKRAGFKVLIIGAGMSGISVAINLKRVGVPFEIIDKNDDVGGTWHQNVYPGVRVDIPSRVYSHSFEPTYPWRHLFASGAELKAYADYLVDKHDLRAHLRLNTEVIQAEWDDNLQRWNVDVRTSAGEQSRLAVNGVVSAVGLLDRPSLPDIEGIASFDGQWLHTSQWRDAIDVRGKRVAVVGTGSSGMQMTPDLAEIAGRLTVFQRTPGWVLGIPGYRTPLPEEAVWLESVPYYSNWARLRMAWGFGDTSALPLYEIDPNWDGTTVGINPQTQAAAGRLMTYMRSKLGARTDLIAKCTPAYSPFAKRIVVDNGWFDALLRDNVELCTDQIERITPRGIRLTSGEERDFDVIVYASGFRANDFLFPMHIVGRDGITLRDFWSKDGPRAYLGIMMPHFPNLWCVYGPNTNPKTGSVIQHCELATRYIASSIKALLENDLRSMDVQESVFDAYQAKLDAALSTSIWTDSRQSSYYKNEKFSRIAVMTAWGSIPYWRWTAGPVLTEFRLG